MNLLNRIMGSYSEREVKKIRPIVQQILDLGEGYEKLSDKELRDKTFEFKERFVKGETLDNLLPEAYAVCREASHRVLGMKHYKTQLIGGVVLHQGRIAEMKTGEGKTLVATLPAYLNALSGNGVHVITVNDYLAARDREEMKKVYEFLGLTTGVVIHGLNNAQRREAYKADITYGTNNEFGFDYLRDNMVIRKEDKVQRELNYCVVDEIDSILIDEARTPLIISGQGEEPSYLYKLTNSFVKKLNNEEHFVIDEKSKSITLTEDGIKKIEKAFWVQNYSDPTHSELQHHITQALRANYIMSLDRDYIVNDGEVVIVDEFTGRTMEGRRFSEGLHQAIEAKEEVEIKKESKTLASITYQNYFRLYSKLSGMTGTGQTEENEFREIYGLDVIVVETNKPVQRIDRDDIIYRTVKGKYNAIVNDIVETYKKKQPILVGTANIENSELISKMLEEKGIPHKVLNAKYHKEEAEIIAKAGEVGSVTIATNMAGRGTDIKLGQGAKEAGGLKVIGTERHESRRIDNQLRGRSGRQGDPGESVFYISLEDDLIKASGIERLKGIIEKLGNAEDEAINNKVISKSIESCQKNIEGDHFNTRKSVIGYDDVLNQQRKIIYKQRNQVLDGIDLKSQIELIIASIVENDVNTYLDDSEEAYGQKEIDLLAAHLNEMFKVDNFTDIGGLVDLEKEKITEKLIAVATDIYNEKEAYVGSENMRDIERAAFLKAVDVRWMKHIDEMSELVKGIVLRAYKQQDPVQAYQIEASELFEEMVSNIKSDVVKDIYSFNMDTMVKKVSSL